MTEEFLQIRLFSEYLDRLEEFHHMPRSSEVFRHEMELMESEKNLSHRKKENLLKARKNQIIAKVHEQIEGLRQEAEKEGPWIRENPWPASITVTYRFPGGKNGDIDHCIAMNSATSLQEENSLWSVVIPTEKEESIELLCYPLYIPFEDYGPFQEPTEAMQFLCRNNRLVQILERMSYVNYYSLEYKSLKSIADAPLKELLLGKNREIITRRHDIYETLLVDGKAHGRWVSEVKAFSIVRRTYPDARFHYEAPWLGGQHLDIFIPSLQAAIEYQGRQHYEKVEYFGGEKAFQDTQARDRLKRERCEANGVKLFTWDFDEPLTQHYFDRHISPFLLIARMEAEKNQS